LALRNALTLRPVHSSTTAINSYFIASWKALRVFSTSLS